MTLNTLSVFLTLVEEMNFTRAAQRLFITQQSLSGHIRRLEEEYGVVLFERRPVLRLTAEGENMLFYAQQMMQAQSAMVSSFADLSSQRRAYLDLGISFMRSVTLGSRIWKRFHEIHPNIQVRLMEANTSVLLEELQQGEIVMMIGVDIRPMPGLCLIPLLKEYMCCIVDTDLYARYCRKAVGPRSGGTPDGWLEGLSTGGEISLAGAGDLPIMFPTKGNRIRLSLERMYRNAGMRPRVILESESQDVLYQLACEGEGAAIVSPMVLFDRKEGGLSLPDHCHIFRLDEAGASTISLAIPDNAELPHFARTMVEVIQKTFDEYGEAIARIGLRG